MKQPWSFVSAGQDLSGDPAQSEFVTKQQIFEKLMRRLGATREMPVCPELNPDVIVISADQTLLFEPQNTRVAEWLYQRYGMSIEDNARCEKIRVHPSLSRKIVDELKAAGFKVNC